MSVFMLEILTPKRQFFKGEVEALTCTLPDGELTVLRAHRPMLAALEIGSLKIKSDGEWRNAFSSEGFIEVRPDEVLVFTQDCEWPEEIDAVRAEEARERELEKLRQKQSLIEYHQTHIALNRAMAQLRVKKTVN